MNLSNNKENKMPMHSVEQQTSSQTHFKSLWMRSTSRLTTTFDSLSQKLRRSTRRREQLINSPGTPRKINKTPVKMYSPFGIETPRSSNRPKPPARDVPARRSLNKPRRSGEKVYDITTTPPKSANQSSQPIRMSPRLANDLQQTQIGVYELQHAANAILNTRTTTTQS